MSLALACSSERALLPEGDRSDTSDTSSMDAEAIDVEVSDAEVLDAEVLDAEVFDAELLDAAANLPTDVSPVDAGLPGCVVPGESGECPVPGFPERPMLLYSPPEAVGRTPVPVLLVFHGGGGNANAARRSACPEGNLSHPLCLHNVGAREGFATAYLNATRSGQGESRIWNAGGGRPPWACVGYCRDDIDEAAYVRAVLDTLPSSIPLDSTRVYAAGLSNGGAVVHRLGCELADRLTAIASLGAGNQFSTSADCNPSRNLPVLQINGTADGCWPYDGGPITCQNPNATAPVISALDSIGGWAERNGCGPVTMESGPERVDDGISVDVLRWTGCAAPVVHYRVSGGGHTWFGGLQYLPVDRIGPTYPDLTNEDLWSFFENLRR
jgi:polyhydroxybutyrate depolymerase